MNLFVKKVGFKRQKATLYIKGATGVDALALFLLGALLSVKIGNWWGIVRGYVGNSRLSDMGEALLISFSFALLLGLYVLSAVVFMNWIHLSRAEKADGVKGSSYVIESLLILVIAVSTETALRFLFAETVFVDGGGMRIRSLFRGRTVLGGVYWSQEVLFPLLLWLLFYVIWYLCDNRVPGLKVEQSVNEEKKNKGNDSVLEKLPLPTKPVNSKDISKANIPSKLKSLKEKMKKEEKPEN